MATASSRPFSIEPDQSKDRDQDAMVTNQSGTVAHEDSTTAQTDLSKDGYVAKAGLPA